MSEELPKGYRWSGTPGVSAIITPSGTAIPPTQPSGSFSNPDVIEKAKAAGVYTSQPSGGGGAVSKPVTSEYVVGKGEEVDIQAIIGSSGAGPTFGTKAIEGQRVGDVQAQLQENILKVYPVGDPKALGLTWEYGPREERWTVEGREFRTKAQAEAYIKEQRITREAHLRVGSYTAVKASSPGIFKIEGETLYDPDILEPTAWLKIEKPPIPTKPTITAFEEFVSGVKQNLALPLEAEESPLAGYYWAPVKGGEMKLHAPSGAVVVHPEALGVKSLSEYSGFERIVEKPIYAAGQLAGTLAAGLGIGYAFTLGGVGIARAAQMLSKSFGLTPQTARSIVESQRIIDIAQAEKIAAKSLQLKLTAFSPSYIERPGEVVFVYGGRGRVYQPLITRSAALNSYASNLKGAAYGDIALSQPSLPATPYYISKPTVEQGRQLTFLLGRGGLRAAPPSGGVSLTPLKFDRSPKVEKLFGEIYSEPKGTVELASDRGLITVQKMQIPITPIKEEVTLYHGMERSNLFEKMIMPRAVFPRAASNIWADVSRRVDVGAVPLSLRVGVERLISTPNIKAFTTAFTSTIPRQRVDVRQEAGALLGFEPGVTPKLQLRGQITPSQTQFTMPRVGLGVKVTPATSTVHVPYISPQLIMRPRPPPRFPFFPRAGKAYIRGEVGGDVKRFVWGRFRNPFRLVGRRRKR